MRQGRRLLWLLVALASAWYVGSQAARAWQLMQSASLCSLSFVALGEFSPELLADSAPGRVFSSAARALAAQVVSSDPDHDGK